MRTFALLVLAPLAGCAVANHHPPVGMMDGPAIEFRNAEGVGRWCPSPDGPGAFQSAHYRACRDGLLADGYREIGPWCGAPQPTAGAVAATALLGGVGGLRNQAATAAACQRRS